MSLPNKILKRVGIIAVVSYLFCFMLTTEVHAQSERDLVLPDENKTERTYNDAFIKDTTHSIPENTSDYAPAFSYKKKNGYGPVKKKYSHTSDSHSNGDKEGKQEEMSTLSFNLFLYVLDRFREDK